MPSGARRPKVGGGGGACPMAGIIRAFPAICTTCTQDLHNICPLFCSAPTAKCVRIQRARSDGAFVQSSSQVRVAVFVAPPCPPELYVFRSGSGSLATQLYTCHCFQSFTVVQTFLIVPGPRPRAFQAGPEVGDVGTEAAK